MCRDVKGATRATRISAARLGLRLGVMRQALCCFSHGSDSCCLLSAPNGSSSTRFVPAPAESSNNASMPRWAVGGTRRLQLVLETPGLADVSPRVRTNCDGPSRLPGEEALLRRDPKTLVSRKARFLRPEGCTRPRDFDSAGPGWF